MKRWKVIDGIVKKFMVSRRSPYWEGNPRSVMAPLTLIEMVTACKHEGHTQKLAAEICKISVGKLQRELKAAGKEWANL